MFGIHFFSGIDRIDQWMGNMFAAGQPISEILDSEFQTLEYFSDWWDKMQDEWSKAADKIKKI